MEVARNLQQCVQHARPCLRDGLFHRQRAADVVADAQMVALGFDVGIHYLIVEKLCGLQLAGNEPVIIIQQTAEKRELSLLIQDLDLHEIRELPSECPNVLVKAFTITLDMRTQ
jgi:hypothetical protein